MLCTFLSNSTRKDLLIKCIHQRSKQISIVLIIRAIIIGDQRVTYFNMVSYFDNLLNKSSLLQYDRFFINNRRTKSFCKFSSNRSTILVLIEVREDSNFRQDTDVHRGSNIVFILSKSVGIPCKNLSFFNLVTYIDIRLITSFNIETTSRVLLLFRIKAKTIMGSIIIFDDIKITLLINNLTISLSSNNEFSTHIVGNCFFYLVANQNGRRIIDKDHVLRLLISHRSTMGIIMQCTRRRK